MALSTSTILETHPGGSDTACSGGFNPANANFDSTGITVTSGNTSAPVITWANYSFVSGDVGHYFFIKAGTNWIAGFYKIASVSGGLATLGAACATSATAGGNSATGGMDYSRKDAARISFTDMVIDGTTNTKFTSAGNPVGKNMIGNLINVTAGTGFTVQFVEVVSTVTTTATCDKSLGTLSSTGGTGALGGALATAGKAGGLMAANLGMRAWLFSDPNITGTTTIYSISAAITNSGGAGTGANPSQQFIGCYQARGDIHMQADGSYTNNSKRPVFQFSTAIAGGFTITGLATLANVIVDCNSQGTTSVGVKNVSGSWIKVVNVKVINFTSTAFTGSGVQNTVWEDCEAAYGTTAATFAFNLGGGDIVYKCYIHDCTLASAAAAINATYGSVINSIIVNITGTTNDGINGNGSMEMTYIINNVILNCARDGVHAGNTNDNYTHTIKNNIFGRNGNVSGTGYGVRMNASVACAATSNVDGNVYWKNTTATRGFMDDTGSSNAQNFDTPYTNVRDVTLTAADANNPFVRYGISGATYSLTDLASTNGTNATPTVTSAGYSGGFVAGDVGSTIQITTQTGNWLEGVYLITSVSGGGAVLDRPCATTASPNGATWYFNDFRLNNTAGAGASCRKVASPAIPGGYPPTYAGGFLDMGALQHADPVGGSGQNHGIYTGGKV